MRGGSGGWKGRGGFGSLRAGPGEGGGGWWWRWWPRRRVGLALCLLSAAPGPGASLHRVILYQTGRLLQKVDGRWKREGLIFFLSFFFL